MSFPGWVWNILNLKIERCEMLGMITFILMMVLAAGVYFLPSIIAASVNKKAGCAIFVVNLFFGWSLIGWVVALAWALVPDEK